MSLKQRLQDDLKEAMRARDEVRVVTLRGALAAIRRVEDAAVQAALEARGGAHDDDTAKIETPPLSDEQTLDVLRREVKQRRDSIDQFEKAKRADLVAKEQAELAVLHAYLPRTMSREQLEAEVRAILTELGAGGPKDRGRVMPVLMARLKDRAEGRDINAVASALLSG